MDGIVPNAERSGCFLFRSWTARVPFGMWWTGWWKPTCTREIRPAWPAISAAAGGSVYGLSVWPSLDFFMTSSTLFSTLPWLMLLWGTCRPSNIQRSVNSKVSCEYEISAWKIACKRLKRGRHLHLRPSHYQSENQKYGPVGSNPDKNASQSPLFEVTFS